jgi:hypothetical protein
MQAQIKIKSYILLVLRCCLIVALILLLERQTNTFWTVRGEIVLALIIIGSIACRITGYISTVELLGITGLTVLLLELSAYVS